jgi:beta-mannosidase
VTTLDLGNGAWELGEAPLQPAEFAGDDRSAVEEWLPARVPGNVQDDLLRAGRILDPYYGQNLADCAWVGQRDWWYRRRLACRLEPGQRAFVTFAGVDYRSAVFADKARLGYHEGMFSPQTYELTPMLAQRGEIELAVRVWGAATLPRLPDTPLRRLDDAIARLLHERHRDRLAGLKCQMHYGWDFAPSLLSLGIWDDVTLKISGPAAILDVWPALTPGQSVPGNEAQLCLRLEIDSDTPRPTYLEVTARGLTFDADPQRFTTALDLRAGRHVYETVVTLRNPRLWQPWDRGRPDLYSLSVVLYDAGGLLDSAEVNFGVRRVRLLPNAGAPGLRFEINGQREFIRGLNWVPADSLPGRLRPTDYIALVSLARQAGANLLRVWGGGLRERRAFYDACDRAGLLVWQEFPFACVFWGRLPRHATYLNLVRQESAAIVRALRAHPCVALWCGGNELSPRRNRHVLKIVEAAIRELDGTRPFRPASPWRGDHHSWDVWHGRAPAGAYRRDRSHFVSELGLQAAPDVESLRRFLPAEQLWPPGAGWTEHNAGLAKLRHYVGDNGDNMHDLPAFVAASQRAQARALQVAIEHLRRRKGRCGGLVLWQFDDPWPAISWSLIDYYRRPKLAYRLLPQWYSPLLVSLDYALRRYKAGDVLHGDVWIVNDGLEAQAGCELRLAMGETILWSAPVDVARDESWRIAHVALPIADPRLPLRLELWQGARRLASNDYDLTFYEARRMRLFDWARRRVADWLLK